MNDPSQRPGVWRILTCEHENAPADGIISALATLGYEAGRAVCAVEPAIRTVEEFQPDLVLVDVLQGQGEDAAVHVGEVISERFALPIVYGGPFTEESALDRAKNTEPYGFLTKPISLPQLRCTIVAALYEHERHSRLKESERKYRSLVQQSLQGVVIAHANPVCLSFVSQPMERITGYAAHELMNFKPEELLQLIHPEDRDRFFTTFQERLLGKPVPAVGQYRIVQKDGEIGWVEISSSLIQYQGEPANQAVFTDITERKRAEDAFRAVEERYRNIMEASTMGIYIAQGQVFKYVNPAMAAMFGYTADEMIDRIGPADTVVPEQRDMVRDSVKQRHTGAHRDPYEFVGVRKDGTTFDGLVWPTPVSYEGRPAAGGTCVDISENKRLESQLRQAQKMEAVGTLAGGVAHDFNNLLQVMLGYTDILLLTKDNDHPDRHGLLTIRQAAKDGADLVRGLLAFSRKAGINPRPTNLNQEVKRIHEILSRTIPKMIDIEVRLDPDLRPANIDPGQIEQVLLNLAVNARDAMPEGGKLLIETSNTVLERHYAAQPDMDPGEYVLLEVSDTGHGMSEEVVNQIFEPFFTTKEVGRGTGLGLATVFGIVKSHRGDIVCHSQPGTGTRFQVYLPAMVESTAGKPDNSIEMNVSGTETILVVDDEERVRTVAETALARCGYSLLTAANGKEALQIYRLHKDDIDLVVLDLIMPEMGGKQCLSELVKINPHVKVVIASGHLVNGPTKDTLDQGAADYIVKPFEAEQLLHVVRKVLDG